MLRAPSSPDLADRCRSAIGGSGPRAAVASDPVRGAASEGTTMLQLVENLQRLGTETAFEVLARAAELERQGKSIINLGIGQPDFKTPAHIVDAAIKALRDGHHGYTP